MLTDFLPYSLDKFKNFKKGSESIEKFSPMPSIFLDLQCYRVLAENKITIEE